MSMEITGIVLFISMFLFGFSILLGPCVGLSFFIFDRSIARGIVIGAVIDFGINFAIAMHFSGSFLI